MTTDEEYLDNLLKSMEENVDTIEPDEINLDDIGINLEEFSSDMEVHEKKASEEDDWNENLDELLLAANGTEQKKPNNDGSDNIDVTQIIDGMDNFNTDLGEISDLLKKSDNNEIINDTAVTKENDEDDMQALLDNIKEPLPEVKEKKKKREKGSRFWGRKKKEKADDEKLEETPESADLGSFDEPDGVLELFDVNQGGQENIILSEQGAAGENEQEMISDKDSEANLFRRIFDYLLREEEEPEKGSPNDENSEILKELEAEDKAGSKKKKKKNKKKKGKNSGKDNEMSADDEAAEENKNKKGKKKKDKKEKQKTEKVKPEKVKSDRVLSKKALTVLIAFCATVIAAVVALSSFLTDYADKKNARKAFYVGNYKEVYQLLYDKNLNESDALLFNRSGVVLQLQSKLDAYNFYKRTGNEPEALNELLQGVTRYWELTGGDNYGAAEELYNIYQSVLTNLNQNYGISEEEAFEINAYDDDTYSKRIYSIVNGTEFVKPGESQEEPKEPQDILTEEEDIIQMEAVNEGA